MAKSYRFSTTETPFMTELFSEIWSKHPNLEGDRCNTVLLALSAYAHKPIELEPNESPAVSDLYEGDDEIDL